MKPLSIFYIVTIVAIVAAIWLPSGASPDTQGKFHVSEATLFLHELEQNVEDFYQKNGQVPTVEELGLKDQSGNYVAKVTGNNPYYAIMKKANVYPSVAGKSLGFLFDPKTGQWDRCSLGTVDIRFKALVCRKPRQIQ